MALPNITISPAGAGVVTPSSLFTYSGTPTTQIEKEFTEGADELHFYLVPNNTYYADLYKLTATAANGYIFDHFEFGTRESWQGGSDTYNLNNGNNPAISNGRPVGAQWAAGIGDFYISYSGGWGRLETLSITAVFKPVHIPTNLLVNSSNRSTPVQLVYDDRPGGSGLLIGDY